MVEIKFYGGYIWNGPVDMLESIEVVDGVIWVLIMDDIQISGVVKSLKVTSGSSS